MSFLQLNESDGASMYIKHSFQIGKFVSNDEPLDIDYMLIHPDFKTGWGKYDGQFEWRWDTQQGVPDDNKADLIKDGFNRAFGARVYLKDQGVFVWQRFSKLECQSFDIAMSSAWKDKVDGKVPCFKYEGSEKISLAGGAKGYVAQLSYVKWVDMPEDFENPTEAQVDNKDDELEDGIPF
jgi:hypothetical protein